MPLDVKDSSQENSPEYAWEREHFLESLDAYKRGLSDAPLLRKWAGKDIKGDDSANEMTFVISTDEVDDAGNLLSYARMDNCRPNPQTFGTIRPGRFRGSGFWSRNFWK